jgi:hypothetical protein
MTPKHNPAEHNAAAARRGRERDEWPSNPLRANSAKSTPEPRK